MIPASMVRLAIGALCLALLTFWMAGNIANPMGGSLNLGALAGAFLAGACLALEMWSRRQLLVRSWAIPLLLFLAWFVIRWILDVGDPGAVKAVTVATTGGVVLYLLMGVVSSFAIEAVIGASEASRTMLRVGVTTWIAMLLLMAIWMLVQMWWLRGSDSGSRLVFDTDGQYQRPGNLLIVMVAIASSGTIAFLRPTKRWRSALAILMVVFFLLIALSASLFAQFFGSNMAAAAALVIAVVTVAAAVAGPAWARRGASPEMVARGLLGVGVASALLLSTGVLALVVFSIDLDRLRITGFGSGSIHSINSRLVLWDNFPEHFAESPVIGNMAVDMETTGPGTYVHSVVGMLLTHTGIVGFLLFGATIVLAAGELLRSPNRPAWCERARGGRAESLHAAGMMIAILVLAGAGAAITWAPMWFVLGLTAPPVAFAVRQRGQLTQIAAEPPR